MSRPKKKHYETEDHAPAIGFDTGAELKILPYIAFSEAVFRDTDRGRLEVVFGDWLISLKGHNLAALTVDLQRFSVFRITAQPKLAEAGAETENDCYVTHIEFARLHETDGEAEGGL